MPGDHEAGTLTEKTTRRPVKSLPSRRTTMSDPKFVNLRAENFSKSSNAADLREEDSGTPTFTTSSSNNQDSEVSQKR